VRPGLWAKFGEGEQQETLSLGGLTTSPDAQITYQRKVTPG
jgi:hypothetical protein